MRQVYLLLWILSRCIPSSPAGVPWAEGLGFVAALSAHILVAHATPRGKTAALCLQLLGQGKHVCTLAHAANVVACLMRWRSCRHDHGIVRGSVRAS